MATPRHRISGGSARGVPIVEPRGARLRPTSGLVREALFNILGDEVEGAAVADLYAGTGALGIEALSRGAASAVFLESDGAACQAIVQTLAKAHLAERGRVVRGVLPGALRSLDGPFDVILMDPPYQAEEDALETLIAVAPLVAAGGCVVYEHASRYNPPERLGGLVMRDRRKYGDTAIAVYEREEG